MPTLYQEMGLDPLDDQPEALVAPQKRSTADAVGDIALSLGQGVVGSVKSLTDLAGADNAVSGALGDASKYLGAQKSAESQATLKASQERVKEAEESGSTWEEAKAYMGMLWDQPAEMLAQGIGSFATLGFGKAASALKLARAAKASGVSKEAFLRSDLGIKAAKEAADVGFKTNIGIGTAQGLGAVKGSQYEQTYENARKAGKSEDEAKALATKAQEYGLESAPQQLLGAGLGAVASATGPIESVLLGAGKKAAGAGVAKSMATGFAKEAVTEGAQGGQERYAGNAAAIDAGVLDPSKRWTGVAGQSLMEGAIGGFIGGVAGPFEGVPVDPVTENLKESAANDGTISRATLAATQPKSDPISDQANEIEGMFRTEGLVQRLRNLDEKHLKDFFAAMYAAKDTTRPTRIRETALQSLNDALRWAVTGNTDDVQGTGTPFRTDLTAGVESEPTQGRSAPGADREIPFNDRTVDEIPPGQPQLPNNPSPTLMGLFSDTQDGTSGQPAGPSGPGPIDQPGNPGAGLAIEPGVLAGAEADATRPPSAGVVPLIGGPNGAANQALNQPTIQEQQAQQAIHNVAQETPSQPKEYRYAMVNRPVDIGTTPKDGLVRTEARPDATDPHHPYARNGVAVFNRLLTAEETKQYEMALMADDTQADEIATTVADDMREYAGGLLRMAAAKPDEFQQHVAKRLKALSPGYPASVGDMGIFASKVAEKLQPEKPAQPVPQPTANNNVTQATQAVQASQEGQAQQPASPAAAATKPAAPGAAVANEVAAPIHPTYKALLGLKTTKVLMDHGDGRILYDINPSVSFKRKHYDNRNGVLYPPRELGFEIKEKASITGNPSDSGYVLIDNRAQIAARNKAAQVQKSEKVARTAVAAPANITAAQAPTEIDGKPLLGTAIYRKRVAQISHFVNQGFTQIEASPQGVALVNPATNQAHPLNGSIKGVEATVAKNLLATVTPREYAQQQTNGVQNDGIGAASTGLDRAGAGEPAGSISYGAGRTESVTTQRGRDSVAGAAQVGGAERDVKTKAAELENTALLERSIQSIEGYKADRQQRLATATNPQVVAKLKEELSRAPNLSHPPQAELAAFAALKATWSDTLGNAPLVAYWEPDSKDDGFEFGGVTHINLSKPHMALQWTIGHEFKHAMGKKSNPYIQRLEDSIWAQFTEAGKKKFYEGLLHREDGKQYANATKDDIEHLREEMLAEFMGSRFTDKVWLKKLAKEKPYLFGEFIREWIPMLDNMIQSLRSAIGLNEDSRKNVDKYLRDLEKAKRNAMDIAIAWAGQYQTMAKSTGADAVIRSSIKLEDDIAKQEAWLDSKAKEAGYKDTEDMFTKNAKMFMQLAKEWRETNPAEVLYSTRRQQADLQAELDDELNGIVSDESIKAHGIHAEDAYADPEWNRRAGGILQAKVPDLYTKGAEATLQLEPDTSGLWGATMRGTWIGPADIEETGYATLKFAKSFIKRFVASKDLFKRGFDILTASDKTSELVNTWRGIEDTEGATRYNKGDMAGYPMKVLAAKLGITRTYDVKVVTEKMDDNSLAYVIEFTNKETGEDQSAMLEVNAKGGKKIGIAHTASLTKGGLGAGVYQMFAEFAASKDIQIHPDESLSGINTYRRTEQMLSAALRTGKSNVMIPHAVQRVYGFNNNAKTEQEHNDNIARLLLTGLRNATELAPQLKSLNYNPETGEFTYKGKNAEAVVKKMLLDNDARAFGLGRSTLARAVMTKDMLAGVEVKTSHFVEPILYSSRESVIDVDGSDRATNDSDGYPIAASDNAIRSFWRWFGDSVVTDFFGRPLLIRNSSPIKQGDNSLNTDSEFLSDDLDGSPIKLHLSGLLYVPGGNGLSHRGIDSSASKSPQNGSLPTPKKPGYFARAFPITPEFDDGIGIKARQSPVDDQMLRRGNELQVGNGIVSATPIYVMDMLTGQELSSKGLLHNDPVLHDLFSVDADNPIAIAGGPGSLSFVVTSSSAKMSAVPDGLARHDTRDGGPALGAGDVFHVYSFGDKLSLFASDVSRIVNGEPTVKQTYPKNDGRFGLSGDIRHSVRPNDFANIEDRVEVSTTVPRARKNKELVSDAVAEKWIIEAQDILSSDTHLAAAEAAIRTYNSVDLAGNKSAIQALHDTVVDNLLWLYNIMPDGVRERAKLWYVGANKIANGLAEKYSIDLRQAAGVLAALSPQKDWFMNTTMGERVIAIVQRHSNEPWSPAMTAWVKSYIEASDTAAIRTSRLPMIDLANRLEGRTLNSLSVSDAAKFVRVFDETYFPRTYRVVTPEGGFGEFVTLGSSEIDADADADDVPPGHVAWGSYNPIEKAIAILRDNSSQMNRTISTALGGEHKVRNFFNNIIRPDSADGHVTIDTHAVAAALFKALSGTSLEVMHNFGTTPKDIPGAGGNAASGASGLYGVFADAYRDAAKQLGILPRELQSITWEAIRSIFTASFKRKSADKVNTLYDRSAAGEITRQEARQQAYDMDGGIKQLPWEGTPEGLSVQDGGTSFDDNLHPNQAQRRARTMMRGIQLSFEAKPGLSTGLMPGMGTPFQSAEAQKQYLMDMQAILRKHGPARLLWRPERYSEKMGGAGWKGITGYSIQSTLKLPFSKQGIDNRVKAEIEFFLSSLGIVMAQEGMGWHAPNFDSDGIGLELNLGGKELTARQFEELYAAVRAEFNDYSLPPIPSDIGVRFLNFTNLSMADFETRLHKAIQQTSIDRIVKEANYDIQRRLNGTDQSQEGVGGEVAGDADTARGTGRPDLQRRSGDVRSTFTAKGTRTWGFDGDLLTNNWGKGDVEYKATLLKAWRTLKKKKDSNVPKTEVELYAYLDKLQNQVDKVNAKHARINQWGKAALTKEERFFGVGASYDFPEGAENDPRIATAYFRNPPSEAHPNGTLQTLYSGNLEDSPNIHGPFFASTSPAYASGVPGAIKSIEGKRKYKAGPNVLPVYVFAKRPFDWRIESHRFAVLSELQDATPEIENQLENGSFLAIESEEVIAAAQAAGFDSALVREDPDDVGYLNVMVFNPKDVTFAIGYKGQEILRSVKDDQGIRSTERADIQRSGESDSGAEREIPKYGKPIKGSTSVVGYHFSKEPRTSLNAFKYGTGLKGAEADRLQGRENADVRPRSFFYVDTGRGVMPESGVGGVGHRVQLDNLYNASKDELGLIRGTAKGENWERTLLKAGFDGYIVDEKGAAQGFAVLVGMRHTNVPVQTYTPKGYSAPPAAPEPYKRGLLSRELHAIDIEAIKAIAPSAKLRMGIFSVDVNELESAKAVLNSQGITLPELQRSARDTSPAERRRKSIDALRRMRKCLG